MKANKQITNHKSQIDKYLILGDYDKAAILYEKQISLEPNVVSHYWHLGLIRLLQGQEIEAQMTWMIPLAEIETEHIDNLTAELTAILQIEAERRKDIKDYQTAWLIRQHIREINPEDLNNLLNIIQLSSHIDIYKDEELPLYKVSTVIKTKKNINCECDLLLETISQVLDVYPLLTSTYDFIEACIKNTNNLSQIINIISNKAGLFLNNLADERLKKLTENFLKAANQNIEILVNLANIYQNNGKNLESLIFTNRVIDLSTNLLDKIAANYLTVRGLMRTGGYWQQAEEAHRKYQTLLSELIETNSDVSQEHLVNLITTVAFAPYFQDEPSHNHKFRNRLAGFCQNRIQKHSNYGKELFQLRKLPQSKVSFVKSLRIGYLSTCLRRHSVGWISRWLFQFHDKEKFEIYAYSLEKTDDILQSFISQQVSKFNDLSQIRNIIEIAEIIYHDEIDILIDLDSITSRKVCGAMALKPAPIQVTWLGSDASGLPAIDYFIADPYVLPESAQNYYAAKIWRLPNTYVAVDGFEVSVPTLKREELNIPNDAVVYLSSQASYKRHPDTVRLQLKILKEVPQSYLLIKGQNNQKKIKNFFYRITEDENIDFSRIIFLPQVELEATHRANLAIADVILDTYPYNGATTTLETLWMCVPLVTKVGQQFAARNSYTMMMNAGITEGIAWTDEEYIEWGIRLGKDAKLRQEVIWKLRQSRQTAPLWNAKQFTREMEKAYEKMWTNYISAK